MCIKRWIILSLLLLKVSQLLADPLPLSDAQIQKLKNYFPEQTNGAPFIWNGTPIEIALPLNQEKRLVFPEPVSVDAKSALTTDQLRIINNEGAVYLTAFKAFPNTRIYVTLINSNKVILLDLATDTNADKTTTYITTDTTQAVAQSITAFNTISSPGQNNFSVSDNDTYVTLIRFAWQQLYAPDRLLSHPQTIVRVPMHTQPMLDTLVYGDKVYAHPEISWMLNNTYVTAVELRNKYPHATTLNVLHDLCGDWQAATLYPRDQLKPAGNKNNDSTELFVVSKKPFGESMEVCNAHA